MSFSNTELKVIKSLVNFAKESKMETMLFAKNNSTIFVKISVTFDALKKMYSNAKRVDTFEEDNSYPVMFYVNDKFTAQLNAEVVKDGDSRLCDVKVSTYKKIEEILTNVQKHKLFGSLTRLSLETMETLIKNFKEEEKKEEDDVKMPEFYGEEEEEYTATGAQQEMQKIIEASLGNIALLLDSKMKKKMSFAALKAIITSVIKTTLKAAGVEDEKKEKEVMKLCEEQGLLPKKKEKGTGPTNAFIIFQQEKRVEMKEKFEGKDSKEISSELGKMWKAMTEEQQKSYKDKAAKKNAEKGAASNKGSKTTKKASKKASSTKYTHKCSFVMTRGERANEECGTTVKSEVPTHDGEWFCSKHVTAMKKRAESASKKSEKKKSEKAKKVKKEEDEEKPSKSKKVKKTKKEEEDEEKPSKSKKVKKEKKEEEEDKPSKSKKVKKEKKEEEKPSKSKKKQVEEEDELEELEDDEEQNDNADVAKYFIEFENGNGFVEGLMTREVLGDHFTSGKKVVENDDFENEGYPVKISATKNCLLVSWSDDEGDKRAKVVVEDADDDIKAIQKYIFTLTK